MNLKQQISDRGLKLKWVADQIGCNYHSFRVYVSNSHLMPKKVEQDVKTLLKIK